MIEAVDLTVRRHGRILLDAVGFDVRPGQVTGVLGAPGAGKTLLLRRMVQLERGRGRTLFDRRVYRALRHPMREVGLLLDPTAGHPEHTVRAHLRLALACDPGAARGAGRATGEAAAPYGAHGASEAAVSGDLPRETPDRGTRERIDAVLDVVGLTEQARTRLGELTEGMAVRLGLAVALLGDPRVLLLDCPDRGLGPEGLAWLGALLRAFTGQGRTALVTGSDTETLAALTDKLLLLESGRLVGSRTSRDAQRGSGGSAVIVRSPQILRFAALLADAGAVVSERAGACLEVRGLDRARVGDLAFRHSVPVHELTQSVASHDPGDAVIAGCSGRSGRVRLLSPADAPTTVMTGLAAAVGAAVGGGSAGGAVRELGTAGVTPTSAAGTTGALVRQRGEASVAPAASGSGSASDSVFDFEDDEFSSVRLLTQLPDVPVGDAADRPESSAPREPGSAADAAPASGSSIDLDASAASPDASAPSEPDQSTDTDAENSAAASIGEDGKHESRLGDGAAGQGEPVPGTAAEPSADPPGPATVTDRETKEEAS